MNKNSKIYIAGHTGLVGSALLRNLINSGYSNIIVKTHRELDLTRQEEVERFFKNEKPEFVFLAAAKVGGIIANMTYTAEFIFDNLTIATNIIHASYLNGVKKLLNLGSSCIYPRNAPQPLKEEYLLTNTLEPTNEAYAIAKIAAIKLCRYYNQQYKTNYISVMPTNLYGINDNFNLETAHVLPALLRKFHLAKLLRGKDFDMLRRDIIKYELGFGIDKKLEIGSVGSITESLKNLGITPEYILLWGSGEPFREFLHVDDLAQACIYLMEKYDYSDIGEFINVGAGEDMKIKDIAGIISSAIGYAGEIRHDTTKPDGMMKKLMDSARIQNLGWKMKYNLEEGIKKTYAWYIDTVAK
jgi:GDP-L-fucose synthase